MCVYIDSRCVLFNILQATNDEVDLSALGSFRQLVEDEIPNVYVDISYASVLSVLEDYSAYIVKEGDSLKRTKGFGRFGDIKFLNDTINRSFSEELRKAIHEASSEAASVPA
jgi:hypothetical protein